MEVWRYKLMSILYINRMCGAHRSLFWDNVVCARVPVNSFII